MSSGLVSVSTGSAPLPSPGAHAVLPAAASTRGEADHLDRHRAAALAKAKPAQPGQQDQQADPQEVQRERADGRERQLGVRRVALPELLLGRETQGFLGGRVFSGAVSVAMVDVSSALPGRGWESRPPFHRSTRGSVAARPLTTSKVGVQDHVLGYAVRFRFSIS